MISSKRLLKIARKWRKLAAIGRRKISASRANASPNSEDQIKSVAEKGHFVVYTADGRRFMITLAYLSNPIFIELFRMSEEQFGLPCDGPLIMPCDSMFMDYAVSFIKRRTSEDTENALVTSIATGRCWTPHHEYTNQQIFVHGF